VFHDVPQFFVNPKKIFRFWPEALTEKRISFKEDFLVNIFYSTKFGIPNTFSHSLTFSKEET